MPSVVAPSATSLSVADAALRLRAVLEGSRRLLVLTGAGCSTDSGIPDYRGPNGVYVRRKDYKPVMYDEFMRSELRRKRYWAGAYFGWKAMREARPNATHTALARLERHGEVQHLFTQNVDGLHTAAGSQSVLELHGSIERVLCTHCGALSSRDAFQELLLRLNGGFIEQETTMRELSEQGANYNPDGDKEILMNVSSFVVPDCHVCGKGPIKPDLVFFGENIPSVRKTTANNRFEQCDGLLVVGSSLHVYSGYQWARRAKERNLPVAIVNLGETRADDLADLKISLPCSDVLSAFERSFTSPEFSSKGVWY